MAMCMPACLFGGHDAAGGHSLWCLGPADRPAVMRDHLALQVATSGMMPRGCSCARGLLCKRNASTSVECSLCFVVMLLD